MFSQLNFWNVIQSWFSSALSPFQSFARCHNLLMCRCWIDSELCPQNLALLYWLYGSSQMSHAFEYHQCPADFWRSIFEHYLSFEHWFTWQIHLNIQLSSLTHQSCTQLLISFSNFVLPSVLPISTNTTSIYSAAQTQNLEAILDALPSFIPLFNT